MISHTYISFWRAGCGSLVYAWSATKHWVKERHHRYSVIGTLTPGSVRALRAKTFAVFCNRMITGLYQLSHTSPKWDLSHKCKHREKETPVKSQVVFSFQSASSKLHTYAKTWHFILHGWFCLSVFLHHCQALRHIESKSWPRPCFHGAGVFIRRAPCASVSMFDMDIYLMNSFNSL